MAAIAPAVARKAREVWSWNLGSEFLALLSVLHAAGPGTIAALDTEFPGVLDQEAWRSSRDVQYKALKDSVELLRPIQLGIALARSDGSVLGAWTFNLRFDLHCDLHTEASIHFLSAAGIDFPRHAVEGIDCQVLGAMLASSPLVACRDTASTAWLTFSGFYDLAYLLKLLLAGPLPADLADFDKALSTFCPKLYELRDWLPYGSLESLADEHGICRHGSAHTAGSDALLTLELFLEASNKIEQPPGSQLQSPVSDEFQEEIQSQLRALPGQEVGKDALPVISSWGTAARLAMCSEKAAPRSLWGAAARQAVQASCEGRSSLCAV